MTMPRLVRTIRAMRRQIDRERVFILIKGLGNMIPRDKHKKCGDFESLVNHIVEVNHRIQKIIW